MGYKELFKRFFTFLFFPSKAWEKVQNEGGIDVMSTYVYPLMGVCGLAVFIRYTILFHEQKQVFQYALIDCARIFVALFASYFIVLQVVKKTLSQWKDVDAELKVLDIQRIAGYGMSAVFFSYFIRSFVPSQYEILTLVFSVYTFFIIKVGLNFWIAKHKKNLNMATLIISLVVISAPEFIAHLFNFLRQL